MKSKQKYYVLNISSTNSEISIGRPYIRPTLQLTTPTSPLLWALIKICQHSYWSVTWLVCWYSLRQSFWPLWIYVLYNIISSPQAISSPLWFWAIFLKPTFSAHRDSVWRMYKVQESSSLGYVNIWIMIIVKLLDCCMLEYKKTLGKSTE